MTTPYSVAADHPKTIWIDLDNSPHVLFFHPIIQELKRRGYRVVVTVRDFAQVVGLSELFHLEYTVIGRHYGKNKLLKTAGLLVRSIQMLPLLVKEKPDLALSHGSRSQLLISRVMGLPSIHAFDYEHATEIPFLRASYAIVPELIPEREALRKAEKIFRYPGIKEDVYSDRLVPDPGLLRTLGVDEKEVVVTVRPPATVAHYHNPLSDKLFQAASEYLCEIPDTRIIMMPRTAKQGLEIKDHWAKWVRNGKIVMPDNVVDGLNLIWNSDMVLSGGGTMIREAAALGVPAYGVFGGEIGAVDRYLADAGRLTIIRTVEDVRGRIVVAKRQRLRKAEQSGHPSLSAIIEYVIEALRESA